MMKLANLCNETGKRIWLKRFMLDKIMYILYFIVIWGTKKHDKHLLMKHFHVNEFQNKL